MEEQHSSHTPVSGTSPLESTSASSSVLLRVTQLPNNVSCCHTQHNYISWCVLTSGRLGWYSYIVIPIYAHTHSTAVRFGTQLSMPPLWVRVRIAYHVSCSVYRVEQYASSVGVHAYTEYTCVAHSKRTHTAITQRLHTHPHMQRPHTQRPHAYIQRSHMGDHVIHERAGRIHAATTQRPHVHSDPTHAANLTNLTRHRHRPRPSGRHN